MTVAFYLKNGKIKRGLLQKWKVNKKNKKKRVRMISESTEGVDQNV